MMTDPVLHISVSSSTDPAFSVQRSFSQRLVKIGRSTAADLQLAFPYVSSRQAEVRLSPEGIYELRDLNAHNPVTVDGSQLQPNGTARITPSSRVELGPLTLRFQFRSHQSGEIGDEHDENERKVHKALPRLRSLHSHLCAARRSWEDSLVEFADTSEDENTRQRTIQLLSREFPESDWVHVLHHETLLIEDPLHASLTALLREIAPHLPPPATAPDAERALTCMANVLRTLAASALDLHHLLQLKLSAFGSSVQDPSGAFSPQTRDEFLTYILDWRRAATPEMRSLGKGLEAHQKEVAAIFDAALETAHEVLLGLSPAVIESNTDARWPTRASVLWNTYVATYAAVTGDGRRNVSPMFREIFSEALSRARRHHTRRSDT